jgi:hypothetical protein
MNPSAHPPIESTQPVKKAYTSPRLEIYGELRQITDAIGCTGTPDGHNGQRDCDGNGVKESTVLRTRP